MKELIRVRVQYASSQQCCKTHKRPLPLPLMETEFSRQIFEKYSNIKINENPFIGSPVVPEGQTDRKTNSHDEANNPFSQFYESA